MVSCTWSVYDCEIEVIPQKCRLLLPHKIKTAEVIEERGFKRGLVRVHFDLATPTLQGLSLEEWASTETKLMCGGSTGLALARSIIERPQAIVRQLLGFELIFAGTRLTLPECQGEVFVPILRWFSLRGVPELTLISVAQEVREGFAMVRIV